MSGTTDRARRVGRIFGGIVGFIFAGLLAFAIYWGIALGFWHAVTETPAFGVFLIIVVLCIPFIVAYNAKH